MTRTSQKFMFFWLIALATASGCRGPVFQLEGGLDATAPFIDVSPPEHTIVANNPETADDPPGKHGPDFPAEPQGLAGCLRVAVKQNRALHRLSLASQRQEEGITAAWRNVFDPELTAGYETSDSADDVHRAEAGIDVELAGFSVGPYIRYAYDDGEETAPYDSSVGIAVSRDLFRIRDGINQRLPVVRATRDWHIALNTRIRELRDLQLRVTQAFYATQNLRRRVEIRDNRVRDAQEFLEAVKAKVENGFSAPVDENNARISLNQAQADLIREQTTLQDAQEELLDLLGLPLSTELALRNEDVTQDIQLDMNPEADMALVLAAHEDVLNRLLNMEVFRQQSLTHLDDLLPELQMRLAAGEAYEGEDPFSGESEADVSVSVRLAMPLDGFRVERAQVRQDALQMQELALELADKRHDLEKQLLSNMRSIQRWNTTVQLASERLEAEQRKLDATLKRYETGTTDNLEVTRAKQALDDAEVSLLDARINRIVAVAKYQAMIPPDRQ